MGRPVRNIDERVVQFITVRCHQQRYLLRPDDEVNAIIGSVIARALHKYPEVTLFVLLAMSNHWHGLARAVQWALSRFMQFVNAQLARRLNEHWKRTGTFWEERFSAQPVLDDAAIFQKAVYTLANPAAAHLCADPKNWIGFSTLPENLGEKPRVFEWFDGTAYNKAVRSAARSTKTKKQVRKRDFMVKHALRVEPLPEFDRSGGVEEQKRALELALAARAEELAAERRKSGRKVVPSHKIRRLSPTGRPKNPKKTPRPLCHTTSAELRRAYKQHYLEFRTEYSTASVLYRMGAWDTEFPPNAFRPPIIEPPEVVAAREKAHQEAEAAVGP